MRSIIKSMNIDSKLFKERSVLAEISSAKNQMISAREYAEEAASLFTEAREILGVRSLEGVRVLNRYDAEDMSRDLFDYAVRTVFSEPQTDFIFAVAGEELGFIGCVAIVLLEILIAVMCIRIGLRAKQKAGSLICCGMGTLVLFQSFLNVGVTTGLLPNTGITLPFVSYGVTSLISFCMGIGICLNVGLQPRRYPA